MSQTTQKVFAPLAPQVEQARQGSAYGPLAASQPAQKLAYIETYGCQMNFSDTEIIASLLTEAGYGFTQQEHTADLILLNSCAIRENAEVKIWNRLSSLKALKRRKPGLLVGLVGCMAERLKHQVLEQEQLVDLVMGPDAYRALPTLLAEVEGGQKAVNVLLSREETYADVSPIRLNTNGVSAFVSIMRGCDNMCSFCVVPFTRGRERSRPAASIITECEQLASQGYKEVTLLGQNVDSYQHEGLNFAHLLALVAVACPSLRIRFSTSHPKDITEDVLHTMAAHNNLCKYIHLPVQSGSNRVLQLMNRGYSQEWYLDKVASIRRILPGCGLSTDVITGFCSETEAEHEQTLSLLQAVGFDSAFMFFYSERPGTLAARKYPDDVPEEVKKRRLADAIALQQASSKARHLAQVGTLHQVLIEGDSKRSTNDFCGRTDTNLLTVFPKAYANYQVGETVPVHIVAATSATLIGKSL